MFITTLGGRASGLQLHLIDLFRCQQIVAANPMLTPISSPGISVFNQNLNALEARGNYRGAIVQRVLKMFGCYLGIFRGCLRNLGFLEVIRKVSISGTGPSSHSSNCAGNTKVITMYNCHCIACVLQHIEFMSKFERIGFGTRC